MLANDFEADLKYEVKRISNDIGMKVKLTDRLNKILRDYLTVRLKQIDVSYCPNCYKKLAKHPQ